MNPIAKDIAQLIHERLQEGYTLDDFKAVHRNMHAKWSRDPKMRQFLRPQTLYTAKFSAYLNIKIGHSDRGAVSEVTEHNIEVLERFVQRREDAKEA